jgi:hypothetical protein
MHPGRPLLIHPDLSPGLLGFFATVRGPWFSEAKLIYNRIDPLTISPDM